MTEHNQNGDGATPTSINLKPTWTETANMMVMLIQHGSPEGVAMARAEILRMGQIIDQLLAEQEEALKGPSA